MCPLLLDSVVQFWAICFGTFALIFLTSYGLSEWIPRKFANQIREELKIKDGVEAFEVIKNLDQKAFFVSLFHELRSRGNCSLTIVSKFSQYHYIAILSAIFSGALGGIAAFLVSSFGWEHSTSGLRGLFVGCAASLPFWLTVIQVFKYQETIAKHEAIYVGCCNIISEMKRVSLCYSSGDDKDIQLTFCKYVEGLEKKAEGVRAIGISFDGSKIGVAKIELPRQ